MMTPVKQPLRLPGGALEQAVLLAVWELGTATAREVHDRVAAANSLAYTTITTVLDRLFTKRLVSRELHGKAFVYRPTVQREVVERAQAKETLSDLLGATPRPALATLVDAVESIDPKLLDELAAVVAARRKSRRGS